MAGLSPKQRVFVAAYIGEAKHNATVAARIAGYAHPGQQGHTQLKKVEVDQAIAEHLAQIKREGIAHRQNRIDELNRRHELMNQIIAERAADARTADIPGGNTGLIVKQLKNVKHVYERDPDDPEGRAYQASVEVWEAAVDTGLLKELRDHEKQVAQELGEWTEKREVSGPGGEPLVIRTISVPLPIGEDDDE